MGKVTKAEVSAILQGMQDRELYEKLLGLKEPWSVENVTLDLPSATVTVAISHPKGAKFPCPVCGTERPIYDHQKRRWRHLDTCGFTTILEAEVPRIQCPEHGVKQVNVPWGEPGSRFTALFEAIAISLLKVASFSDVARHLRISWDAASGIMERAVRRGLARREAQPLRRIGIDETSFQKRHEYVTVVFDQERSCVVDVLDGRKKETLKTWLAANQNALGTLESVSMDMWDAYIGAVRGFLPDGVQKICFDRFHVAQYFNKAVDKVRAEEHREFKKRGEESPLTRTKHAWLRKGAPDAAFSSLARSNLKTARAWRIKEAAAELLRTKSHEEAARDWRKLLSWMMRSRLGPVVKVAAMIRQYLWGILNAARLGATNAKNEAVNATIQKLKVRACGFRNRSRFKMVILSHLGGLSLLPEVMT